VNGIALTPVPYVAAFARSVDLNLPLSDWELRVPSTEALSTTTRIKINLKKDKSGRRTWPKAFKTIYCDSKTKMEHLEILSN